jgi:sec-independent protein translocase protein TatB
MFDVGFSELLVIGVVALLVIGPEKLPRVARTVGALMGRAQRYVNDVKADINREIELDELRKLKTTVTEAAASIETSVRDTVSSFEAQANELNQLASGTDPVSGPQAGAFEDAPAPAAPAPEALAAAEASIREAVAGDVAAHADAAAPAAPGNAAAPVAEVNAPPSGPPPSAEPAPAQGSLALDAAPSPARPA